MALDREWRYRYVNHAVERATGCAASELIGRVIWDAFPSLAAPAFSSPLRAVLHDGVSNVFDWTPPDGRTYEVHALPHEGGVLMFSRDVTERRRSDDARRVSEERYRRLVDQAPDGIVVHCEGAIVFANAAFASVVGAATPESLTGRALIDLLHPSGRDGAMARLRDVIGDRSPAPLTEERLVRIDGGEVGVEIAAIPFTFEGRPAVQLVVRDNSARSALEEQLRQAQKMEAFGQLAGGVAHDFNNLLTAISGYAEMVHQELAPDSSLAGDVREISKASERAAGLTRQLLAFSRKQVLQPRQLDLNNIVRELQRMLVRVIGEDIDFRIVLEQDVWPTSADRGQIEQVILNLAVNARDAMPGGGVLTVETSNVSLDAASAICRSPLAIAPGEYVRLTLSDTGHGMDATTQARIFEPFFTTKEQGRGTGLGLATVYGIVRQSEGHIEVYSEVGRGTTFKVYLRRAASTAEDVPQVEAAAARGTETVLMVEDDAAVRSWTDKALRQQGYTVLVAANGDDAVRIANAFANPIDLLLTDVVMPGLGGPATAAQIRSARPGLKVLFVSGYTGSEIARRGIIGADAAFLEKPFSSRDLARMVRSVIDGQSAAAPVLVAAS